MKKNLFRTLSILAFLVLTLMACAPAASPVPPTPTTIPATSTPPPTAIPPTSTPPPTATPTLPPTRTATPAATPRPTGILVFNSEKWECQKSSASSGEFYCQDGEYHLINKGTGIAASSDGQIRNFILQAQMRLIGESGSYGVVFRGQRNPSSFYIFRIRSTGQFQLIKWSQSQSQNAVLLPWTDSSAIKKGQAVNQLEVIAQETRITLFANSEQLATMSDASFTEGSVGPVAMEQGHTVISNLKLWVLPNLAAAAMPTATAVSNPPVLPTSIATPTVLDRGGTGSGKAEIEITFICNEGFLLTSSRGEKILVDAMLGTDFPNYGVLSPEQRTLLGQALPPFDKVDLILVTHEHADHFDPELVKAHMQRNPRAMLASTARAGSVLMDFFPPTRIKPLSLAEGKRETFTLNGIELTALGLRHSQMTSDYSHLGFLFTIGGWRILHMGDSEDTDKLPADLGQIDVAFIGTDFKSPPQAKDIIQMHWKVPSPNKAMQKWVLR